MLMSRFVEESRSRYEKAYTQQEHMQSHSFRNERQNQFLRQAFVQVAPPYSGRKSRITCSAGRARPS